MHQNRTEILRPVLNVVLICKGENIIRWTEVIMWGWGPEVVLDQVHLQEQNKPRNSAQCAADSPWVEARLIGAFRTTSSLHLDVFAANNVTKKTSETWSSSQYYKEHKVKLTRCKKDQ